MAQELLQEEFLPKEVIMALIQMETLQHQELILIWKMEGFDLLTSLLMDLELVLVVD